MIQKIVTRYMFSQLPQPLVKASWVRDNLKSLKVVDGSWYMPNSGRSGLEEFKKSRILTAVHFDIDTVCQKNTTLPHMVPPKAQFEDQVSTMGISDQDNIVVYDATNLFSACRVYWMFRYFGHKNVSIIDGGLPLWIKQGGSIDQNPPQEPLKSKYVANEQPQLLRSLDQILQNTQKRKQGSKDAETVIDMRPAARFAGEQPEVRPGLACGHMPFSKNLPFSKLIDSTTGEMVSNEQIKAFLAEIGVDWKNEHIINSCGSGVTACILYVALEKIGAPYLSVYDGSWTEYGSQGEKVEILRGNQ